MKSLCLDCEYFTRRPGVKSCFINKCAYWGLVSKNVLPDKVVFSSIGKECPFFKKKIIPNNNQPVKKPDDGNLDILI